MSAMASNLQGPTYNHLSTGAQAMPTLWTPGQDNPWETLEPSKIRDARARSEKQVVGQHDAMDVVVKMLASRFLCPPPGVGEGKRCPILADLFFGDEAALKSFDMGEYGERPTQARLIGLPSSYEGYEQGGTPAVDSAPSYQPEPKP